MYNSSDSQYLYWNLKFDEILPQTSCIICEKNQNKLAIVVFNPALVL